MVMPEAQGRGYCWGSKWGWGSGRGGDNEDGGVGREAEMRDALHVSVSGDAWWQIRRPNGLNIRHNRE